MVSLLSLIRLRGARLSRIAATIMLLLVVTPFTAPFSTFDLADLGDAPLHGGLLSSVKTIEDANVVPLPVVPGLPPARVVAVADAVPAFSTSLPVSPRFVLRL